MKLSLKNTGKRISKIFSEYVAENRLWYALAVAAVICGTVAGAMSAVSLSTEKSTALTEYTDSFVSAFCIQPISRAEVFRTSACGNLKLILLIWITGFGVGLIPLAILNMGISGYCIGFTAAFLVQTYRVKGILLAILSLLPRAVILIPTAALYTVFCIKYALSRRKTGNASTSVRRAGFMRNTVCLLMATAMFMLCSLIDGFVIPSVLKPICLLINA